MATIYDILNQLHQTATSTRDQGDLFERLMVAFLRTDPQYAQLFSKFGAGWTGRGGQGE